MGVLIALLVCVGTIFTLYGGWQRTNRATAIDMSPEALVMGALAVVFAGYYLGPYYGGALIFTVMIHEFGHVAAFRVAGHDDATFRLVPLMGGVAISRRQPDSQILDFYISLMGPAICIAPTLLAFLIYIPAWTVSPQLGEFVWAFANFSAALNFLNLLPLWPLDGGKCVRILTLAFAPKMVDAMTKAMAFLFIGLALYSMSVLLLIFALMSLPTVLQPINYIVVRPMKRKHAFLALGCYLSTTAFFGLAGYRFILNWLG